MGIAGLAKFIGETYPGSVEEATRAEAVARFSRIAVDVSNECYVQMYVARTNTINGMGNEEVRRFFKEEDVKQEFHRRVQSEWLSRMMDFFLTDLRGRGVAVFDGPGVPVQKETVRAQRKERTAKAREGFEDQVRRIEEDEFANPHRYRKILADYITSKPPSAADIRMLVTLLLELGVPVVKAPGEGEKHCARLCFPDTPDHLRCEAVWSADIDSLLFGAPVMIQRKRGLESLVKIFKRDRIDLPQGDLVKICVAHGCDYDPRGIPGIGLKKASKLLVSRSLELPDYLIPIAELFCHDRENEPLVETPWDPHCELRSHPSLSLLCKVYGKM